MNNHLGDGKHVFIPGGVYDSLVENGLYALGMYVIIARRASQRGRVRFTSDELLDMANLSDSHREDLEKALDFLWVSEIIEKHQIIKSDGEIEEYWYVESQDRKSTGGLKW